MRTGSFDLQRLSTSGRIAATRIPFWTAARYPVFRQAPRDALNSPEGLCLAPIPDIPGNVSFSSAVERVLCGKLRCRRLTVGPSVPQLELRPLALQRCSRETPRRHLK